MQFLALPLLYDQSEFLWPNLAEYVALPHIDTKNTLIPRPGRWLGACLGLVRAIGGDLVPSAASPPTVVRVVSRISKGLGRCKFAWMIRSSEFFILFLFSLFPTGLQRLQGPLAASRPTGTDLPDQIRTIMAGTMRLTQVSLRVNKTNSLGPLTPLSFPSILIPTISPTVSFPTFSLGTIIIIQQGHIRL